MLWKLVFGTEETSAVTVVSLLPGEGAGKLVGEKEKRGQQVILVT